MRSLLIAAVIGLGACTTATANPTTHAAAAEGPRDCFLASSAYGYSLVDDHSVRVDAGPSRHYLLHTDWDAHDLDWTFRIALHSGGTDWICTGNGLGVEVSGGRPRRTYPITEITRLPNPPPANQAQQPAPEAHGS